MKAENQVIIKKGHLLYNEGKPAVEVLYAKVRKYFVKPRFEKGNVQGRMRKQDNVIDNIINNFNPDLLFGHEGGFQGIPIITYDGRVVCGNHRAEAIQSFNNEQFAKFAESFKQYYGVELESCNMPVRILPEDTPEDIILEIAHASNIGRETTLGEKVLTTHTRYIKEISELPPYIESSNVDELQCMVAKYLDKVSNGLEIFDTNLALFSHLAGIETESRGIMEAINAIQSKDPQRAKKIKDSLISNAGSFYNISQSKRIPQINIAKYITEAIFAIAYGKNTKAQNCAVLADKIESFLLLTPEGKEASLVLNPDFIKDIQAGVLGASILKFVEQENPAQALYLFLKDFIDTLELQVAPTLMEEGKPLSEANIYDALKLFVVQGRANSEVSRLVDLLGDIEQWSNGAVSKTETKAEVVEQESCIETLTKNAELPQSFTIDNMVFKRYGKEVIVKNTKRIGIVQKGSKIDLSHHLDMIKKGLDEILKINDFIVKLTPNKHSFFVYLT